MKRFQRAVVVATSLAVFGGLGVPVAEAEPGSYQINSCASDPGRYSTQAFGGFATRGMRIARRCRPGAGLRGMIVSNVSRQGRVKRHSLAALSIIAAPGTVFRRFTWAGSTGRRDCSYSLQLYATGPSIRTRSLLGARQAAFTNCPKRGAQGTVSKIGTVEDVQGATRITQRVVCRARPGDTCSARGLNYVQLRRAEVTVQDIQPPSVRITGGSLFGGGWVRGERTVSFEASDNLGIRSAQALVAGVQAATKDRLCTTAAVVPCSSGADFVGFDTRRVVEGTQPVVLQATDGSGLTAGSAPVAARIDNTAPGSVVVNPRDGESWRASNVFGGTWENPSEGDRAPITAVNYRVCRSGGACEDVRTAGGAGVSSLDGIQVPAPGEWKLKIWREDAAGNTDEAAASSSITLRYDPEAPKIAIDQLDAADPTLLSASIDDPLSGVAGGGIEIAREGTGTWQALKSTLEGGHLRARVDDATLPAGRYFVRARGTDTAGNAGESDKRADGSIAAITLPLRVESRLYAGFLRKSTVRKVVRQEGRRRTIRSTVIREVAAARVRRGRLAFPQGRLVTPDGNGLPNAAVYAFVRVAGGLETYAGMANTDVAGRYRFSLRPAANQTLRFLYLGAPSIRPAGAAASVTVPAESTFRVSRTSLLNGQSVRFSGRLDVAPTALAGGKLVELQTRLGRRWETFRGLRTDGAGHWGYSYRFTSTTGLKRYAFRVRIRPEGGYPYGAGSTGAIRVKVRGR